MFIGCFAQPTFFVAIEVEQHDALVRRVRQAIAQPVLQPP